MGCSRASGIFVGCSRAYRIFVGCSRAAGIFGLFPCLLDFSRAVTVPLGFLWAVPVRLGFLGCSLATEICGLSNLIFT